MRAQPKRNEGKPHEAGYRTHQDIRAFVKWGVSLIEFDTYLSGNLRCQRQKDLGASCVSTQPNEAFNYY